MKPAAHPGGERCPAPPDAAPTDAERAGRRLAQHDWPAIERALDADGFAVVRGLLDGEECARVAAMYGEPSTAFRSRVVMARHGFGQGEYQYFDYPLPPLLAGLRAAAYARLVPIANRWRAALGAEGRYPEAHADYIDACRAAGQHRPTPLLLKYGAGDYNCLHQDLYGEQMFPLQLVVLLSQPGRDFEGGELVMTEQRPRAQSRPMVVPLRQGDAAVIAVQHRPVQGQRGTYRVNLRHGVSRVHSGSRFTLGIIFHDAL